MRVSTTPTPCRSCQPLPLAEHKQKPRQGSLLEAVEVSSWGTARMEGACTVGLEVGTDGEQSTQCPSGADLG